MGKRSYTRRSETNMDASATENKTRQSLRIKSQEAGPAKPKRKRITQEQFQALSALFQETDTPNFELREQLAKKLNMTNREVQVWFQNRRAKFNRARLQQQRQQQQQQQQQQQMQRHHQHHYQQQQHQHHLHQSEQQQPLHTVHRDGIVYVYPSWSQTQSTGVPQQLPSMSSTFPLSHAKIRGPLFPNEEDGQDRAELAPLDTQTQWRYNLGCLDEKERSPTDSVLSPSSSSSSCSPTLPLLPYPELHDNLTSLEILALAADYLQRCEEHVAKHQQQQQRQPLEVQHEHSFASSSSSATSTCTTSTLTTAPTTPTSAASTSFTTACSCNAPPSSNTTNGSWRPWL